MISALLFHFSADLSGVGAPSPRIPMKYVDTKGDRGMVGQLLEDDGWVAEQKMDGTRGLAVVTAKSVWWPGTNGKGSLSHSAATQHFDALNAALMLSLKLGADDEVVLDGEIMIRTGEYHLFDLPYVRVMGRVLVSPDDPLGYRRSVLNYVARMLEGTPVKVVRQERGVQDKSALVGEVQLNGGEGVVFKHLDRRYESGARSDAVLKYKFVKTADVVVIDENRSRNAAGREMGNITFGFYIDRSRRSRVVIGKCSCIGKPHVEPGDVIEIAYLYRDETGGLVQPRMMRIREDKDWRECSEDQFPPYSRDAV